MFDLTNPGPPGQTNLMWLISPQTVKAYCFVNVVVLLCRHERSFPREFMLLPGGWGEGWPLGEKQG